MSRLRIFLGSSVGLKVVMALTGAAMCAFVLGHMSGNLLAFQGPEAFNGYAHMLRKVPSALWAARIGLVVSAALHVWAYLVLTRRSLAARPGRYAKAAYEESTWASRTMRWTGPILLAFIVFHILHFTVGTVTPGFTFQPGDAFHNLSSGLAVTWVSAFYLVAVVCLALHLYHGVWSLLQTLGLSHPRLDPWRKRVAVVFTAVVCAGFAAVPMAAFLGAIRPDLSSAAGPGRPPVPARSLPASDPPATQSVPAPQAAATMSAAAVVR